jgi:hypothetical protein
MLKLRWLIIITLLSVILGTATPVVAANPPIAKENPQSAQQIFSSIALLNYYASSLDYIIQLDQTGSITNLDKVPFANVPQELDAATSNFANNSIDFTTSLVDLFRAWNQQNIYIRQYRLNDAAALYNQISDQLPTARQKLSQIELSVTDTGAYLNIGSAPSVGGLKPIFDEVRAKIQQLSGMLDLLSHPLVTQQLAGVLQTSNIGLTPEQLANLTPAQLAALLKSINLTLAIDPVTAYVGDEVTFKGTLSAQGQPLPARAITILLNNADLLTVQTDTQGQFQGTFKVPYRYVPEIPVQAIYYPQGNDAGTYLAATSPLMKITVLFYTAQLTLKLNNPVYPGKEAMLIGTFDYGNAPVLQQRTAELYLDNNLQEQFDATPVFNRGMMLDAQTAPGKHIVTISVPAVARYAPVLTTYVIDVIMATPILDLNMPVIGFIPGNIHLNGKLYSSAGPLENAAVVITEGKTSTKITTRADGTFNAKIGIGMGLSLLGTQMLTVQVQPREPWNAPLTSTKSIFLFNFINIGLIIIVLVLLAFYLPRRFKKWFSLQLRPTPRPPSLIPPVTTPVYLKKADVSLKVKDSHKKEDEADNTILYWYRVALKLVQNITKMMMKPQQTLREYERETSKVLGPAGKYFIELTHLLEKRLYGKRQPDASDIQKSQELALELQKEAGSKQ